MPKHFYLFSSLFVFVCSMVVADCHFVLEFVRARAGNRVSSNFMECSQTTSRSSVLHCHFVFEFVCSTFVSFELRFIVADCHFVFEFVRARARNRVSSNFIECSQTTSCSSLLRCHFVFEFVCSTSISFSSFFEQNRNCFSS